MVGKLARMRVSSVIRISPPRTSIGTLKSTRTNTRFPRTSKSRTESFGILLVLMIMIVIVLDEICCLCFIFAQNFCSFRKLAVPFRYLKRNAGRAAIELISRSRFDDNLIKHVAHPTTERDCLAINIQLFVVEMDSHPLMKNDHEQEYEHDYERLLRNQFQHIHATVAVAPFVIVPTDDFHETVAKHKRQLAVKNAGVRIANYVLRHERLIAVFDHALVAFCRCSFLEGGIDTVNRRI